MSEDAISKQDREALEQLARAVMQQVAEGRPRDEIVRDLSASGMAREAAERLVDHTEQEWRKMASSPDAAAAFHLQMRFPEMRPIDSAPSLFTMNGIGTMFCGARDHDPDSDTYVKTQCFSVLFVPLIALRAFRVAKARGQGWHVLGRVPLSKFAKGWNGLLACALLALVAFGGWSAYRGSDDYQAAHKLSRAEQAAQAGNLVEAARLYGEVARGYTQHAAAAREGLVALVQRPEMDDLPPNDLRDVFRATAGAMKSEEQKKTIVAQGLRQCDRLASSDLAAAFGVLQAVVPLLDRAQVETRLSELLAGPLDAASCATVAHVVPIAREVAGPQGEQAVLARALAWLEGHPAADARDALRLLDQLTGASEADAARIAKARRNQLERLVKADPKDTDAAVQLALLLEKDGDAKQIEALLVPHRDKLGAGEGARLLGQLLAAQGKFDESYALLSPYMEQQLGAFHEAEKALEDAFNRGQERVLQQLRQGSAPGFNYAKYKAAGQNQQEAMLHQYLNEQLRDDPAAAEARDRLVEHGGVVPAALDLGMVMLQRARAMGNADARRAELERAEKTFLAVRGVAGGSDKYLLQLGQVYYWLGKHDEGHQQFDQLLTSHNRDCETLVAVAGVLRELGAYPEARNLMEEAYGKTSDAKMLCAVANLRAVTSIDLKDKITWLDRCDKTSAATKTLLAETRGEQAADEGKYEDAARHYREAMMIYDGQTKNATIFNNGALACFALFEITGEKEALERGTQWLEKAVALSPSGAIVLTNASQTLLRAAVQDLLGPEISLRELKTSSDLSLLDYLAADGAALDKLRERVRQHSGARKALGQLDQLMVLAPKNPVSYLGALQIHAYARDAEALRRVSRQVAEAKPDISETIVQSLRYYRYEDDDSTKEKIASRTAHLQSLVERQGREKKGPAFAAAVGELLEMQAAATDVSAVEAEHLAALAEQAHAAAPSLGTYRVLIDALLLRAGKTLAASHPEFAAATGKTGRALPLSYCVVLAMGRGDALASAASADKDVQKVVELTLQMLDAFPDVAGYRAWATIRAAHPRRAEAVVKTLAGDEVDEVGEQIAVQLFPVSAPSACREYWKSLAAGRAGEAGQAIQRVAELGVPLPRALFPARP